MGGAVRAGVAPDLAEALYRSTEYRGVSMRLDTGRAARPFSAGEQTKAQDPLVGEVVRSVPWELTRTTAFREISHVNLQGSARWLGRASEPMWQHGPRRKDREWH